MAFIQEHCLCAPVCFFLFECKFVYPCDAIGVIFKLKFRFVRASVIAEIYITRKKILTKIMYVYVLLSSIFSPLNKLRVSDRRAIEK